LSNRTNEVMKRRIGNGVAGFIGKTNNYKVGRSLPVNSFKNVTLWGFIASFKM
jgi:hypothetical protein